VSYKRLCSLARYSYDPVAADLTLFYQQYKSVEPWLKNDNPPELGLSGQMAVRSASLTTSRFF
jgi:succinate dehydrogenase/fumarate reductase-like Fe-S protein